LIVALCCCGALAALVACRRPWTFRATVVTPWNTRAALLVTSDDGYRSHVAPPNLFDSSVEQKLAESWGESRDGWRLSRDTGILQDGQITFVPDFLLRHDDGREAFLEIVGFWTPQYLETKRRTIARFAGRGVSGRRIVLAVAATTARPRPASNLHFVTYRSRVDPLEAVRAVEVSFSCGAAV
jgi:uncharacterized protein